MDIKWSDSQLRRLIDLNAPAENLEARFESIEERDKNFLKLEKYLVKSARFLLNDLRETHRRPRLCRLETKLIDALTAEGFTQVSTPTIMSRGLLAKMTITPTHPLYSQVFWLDKDRCLRPMLAPHLYYLLKDLLRIWPKPVRIFETGSCFRKETHGAQHAAEFTMLNLVEMGLPKEDRNTRLEHLARLVTQTAGIENYRLESETSTVYGETTDVVAGENSIEIGSAAVGPHPLDEPWRIYEPWVGIGFGLERMLMVKENSSNLARMGRSLAYLDGVKLNV